MEGTLIDPSTFMKREPGKENTEQTSSQLVPSMYCRIRSMDRSCKSITDKNSQREKMNWHRDITNGKLYHRGQIDVLEMPIEETTIYKYLFVYEDCVSKFVVLKALRNNTAREVAVKLLDIIAIIGAPQVLQSNNGRKFAEQIVRELRLLWKDLVILHGEISESEEITRDFKSLLKYWSQNNPNKMWYEGLKSVQVLENSTFRCENGKIPYDLLFGRNVHEELKKLTAMVEFRNSVWTEEEWIDMFFKKRNDDIDKLGDEVLIQDSSFAADPKDTYNQSREYDSDSQSRFSESRSRDEPLRDAHGFNFVNVKSEPLNINMQTELTDDTVFENESISPIAESKRKLCTDSQNLKCKVCQKKYMKPGHLKNHMRTHAKGKKFECTQCNKTFHVRTLYEKHMRQSHGQSEDQSEKSSILSRTRRTTKRDSVTNDTESSDVKTSASSNSKSLLNYSSSEPNSSDTQLNIECRKPAKTFKTARTSNLVRERRKHDGKPGKPSSESRTLKANGGDPTLECTYCKQKFNFPSVLKRHMRSHTNERPYICQVCNKSFKQLGHLSQHSLTHKDYRSFQCAICGVKFESLDSLKIHSQSHKEGENGETNPRAKEVFRLFECDNCKKVFTTKSVLERHIFTHTHERQFGCKVCGKRFKQAGHVKSHMLVHTGERKFECTVCNKRFSLSNSLKKHMYVHNGEKPYQCDVCGARFLEKRNLNGHLMTHTNERPFRCKVCGKRYTLADTLRRHVSAAHEDGRTYQCEICAKMFKQLAHLSVHKKVHNDERPFQCHLCEKNFKHKNVLKSHLAIHANVRPFECDVCKATFVRKTNLQTHIASAHMNERPYACNICGKKFKQISHLNGHVVVHSNSMPYQCDFCDRRCNRLDNLKKHMRLHTKNKE